MKNKCNPHTTGLTVGSFVGLIHALWAFLVAMDLAQMLLEWVFALHFLANPYTVQPFSLGTAFVLVVMTFIVGYVAGWVFASVWNWAMKKK